MKKVLGTQATLQIKKIGCKLIGWKQGQCAYVSFLVIYQLMSHIHAEDRGCGNVKIRYNNKRTRHCLHQRLLRVERSQQLEPLETSARWTALPPPICGCSGATTAASELAALSRDVFRWSDVADITLPCLAAASTFFRCSSSSQWF